MKRQTKLDELAVQIELTLISLLQGLAVAGLATAAVDPIMHHDYMFWPYIATGLFLILFFWSQSLIHALGFIRWPLNIFHNFLYFIIVLIELLLFSQVTNPVGWYGLGIMFFVVSWVTYYHDLHLIQQCYDAYTSSAGQKLYHAMVSDQKLGLRLLIPLGLAYNLIALALLSFYPHLFLVEGQHVWLALGQMIFGFMTLVSSAKSFKARSNLIAEIEGD